MGYVFSQWEQIVRERIKLREMELAYWIKYNLFTFNWWLILLTIITFWIVWWRFLDKNRLVEILLFGSFATIIANVLDVIGTSFVLWSYPYALFPVATPLLPANLVGFPVVYMLTYQYYPGAKEFFVASVCVSLFFAFGVEVLLEVLGIYQPLDWKHVYSFPIYILIALLIRYTVNKIMLIQKKSGENK
jgi:hypothetical protein